MSLPTAIRDLTRALGVAFPGITQGEGGGSLEAAPTTIELPRVERVSVIEGTTLQARAITGDITPGFDAFLDGTQRSHVVHWDGGVPIVAAQVAAVIRVRVERRMLTWRDAVRDAAIYAPRAFLPDATWQALEDSGVPLRDTTDLPKGEELPAPHPMLLQERALRLVQNDRERVERTLGEAWVRDETGTLYVDGGISTSASLASASNVVGVVKSHRTLYGGDALDVIMRLAVSERSTIFRIEPSRRFGVASWYLRLRDATVRDPLWGLVRLETGESRDIAERADAISRWLLAELSPLALPDGRWDRMIYAVRDCEEYLRAVS